MEIVPRPLIHHGVPYASKKDEGPHSGGHHLEDVRTSRTGVVVVRCTIGVPMKREHHTIWTADGSQCVGVRLEVHDSHIYLCGGYCILSEDDVFQLDYIREPQVRRTGCSHLETFQGSFDKDYYLQTLRNGNPCTSGQLKTPGVYWLNYHVTLNVASGNFRTLVG